MALCGCAPVAAPSGEVRGVLHLDLQLVDLPDRLVLDEATLHVDAVTLDRCDAERLMIPVDRPLDALDPSLEPLWMRPGGYCAASVLIGDDGALVVSGTLDGAPIDGAIALGGVTSARAFLALEHDVILAVSLDRLDLDALAAGDAEGAWPGPWPAPAVPWADLDGDGRIGPGDEPLDPLAR